MKYGKLEVGNVNHSDVIYTILSSTGCSSYLELGLYVGETINKINTISDYCVGVDIKPVNINCDFFCGATNDFFKQNDKTFDAIFIDADHSFESVLMDFSNSVKVLNKCGIIFIHDTDPICERYLDPGYCGDSNRLVSCLEGSGQFNIVTIPVLEAGLSLVTFKHQGRVRNT